MGLLNFTFFALWMLEIIAAHPKTERSEVDAINAIISHWNLSKLNVTGDPCNHSDTSALEDANPGIVCQCSLTVCHITELKIYALDIYGIIPQALFNLTKLTNLNLGQNVLYGPIPAEIGKLTEMQYLSLGINNLTGPVPAELGKLTKLISLSFGSNNLNGPLPSQLGNLISLQQLYIDSSGVSGAIPQELSNLKSLQILWASDNRFTGKIPEFLGNLTGLKVLRLEGTSLEGPIPIEFAALTKLEDLRIGDLNASGSSLDFVENLTSLSTLSLRNCRIRGEILEKLSSFPKLLFLDLSFNKLKGQIPASFKNSNSLRYLYLGSNNLSGDLPSHIMNSSLVALDVSFNNLKGSVPLLGKDKSINVVGTSINDANLNENATNMLRCLQGRTKCSSKHSSTSFSVNSGGPRQSSFDDDSEHLGAASLYAGAESRWAVSSNGLFISNPKDNIYQDKAETDSQVTNTLTSELYKTARVAPSSLRYYGLGLENGLYKVELHFAEIQMDDSSSTSWKALGRRLFDVFIQGEKVLEDFNILNEAGGSKTALVKEFTTNVTNTVVDIHLFWAGKGTCCIPLQSTFGPLISAINVSRNVS
ncbi:hypothetical protein OROGR_027217 [Orobanche gracilis]